MSRVTDSLVTGAWCFIESVFGQFESVEFKLALRITSFLNKHLMRCLTEPVEPEDLRACYYSTLEIDL